MTQLIIYGSFHWPCHVVQFQRSSKIGGEEPEKTEFRPQYMWYALRGPWKSRGDLTLSTSCRLGDILVMSTPCKGHVLVVQRRQARFLELKVTFLNGNLGHQRALRARLNSNGVSAIKLISDGNLDESCKCPVLFDAG